MMYPFPATTATMTPPSPNRRPPLATREGTALLMAVAMVKNSPTGAAVLERLEQIIGNVSQRQQQKGTTDATNSASPTRQQKNEQARLTRREDFSPERTRSPSPSRTAQQVQQQQQQQQSSPGENGGADGDYLSDLRVKQLEAENDALRRKLLEYQLKVDKVRIAESMITPPSTPPKSNGEKAASSLLVVIKTSHLMAQRGLNGEVEYVSVLDDDPEPLSQQVQEQGSAELLEYKARLLSHLEVIHRNRFFLEAPLPPSPMPDEQRSKDVETSLWNSSLAMNLVQAINEAISMLCLPSIRLNLSKAIYLYVMDIVQECLTSPKPLLTPIQHKTVLQALDASWNQILLPVPSVFAEPQSELTSTSPSGSGCPIARFHIIIQDMIHRLDGNPAVANTDTMHQTRYLKILLRILLAALVRTLDAFQQLNTPRQDLDLEETGQSLAAKRLNRNNRVVARLEKEREVARQLEQGCAQMVNIACSLLVACRKADGSRSQVRDISGNDGTSNRNSMEGVQQTNIFGGSVHVDEGLELELERVEADCDGLMNQICASFLLSRFATTQARASSSGIPLWLIERFLCLISIDNFPRKL
ncbi:hypothetical protein BGX33_002140 [Mortierella sp. NVP41]|nr:hypothetical protein BGX33_002140 [Mortierella sp. NVP41]